MQPIFERGDDPEVSSTSLQPPEEIGVLLCTRMKETTISGDDVGAQEVVTNQTVLAGQPAEAATEGEPGNPGGRDCPADRRQPEGLRLVIELGPDDASFSPRRRATGSTRIPFMRERSSIRPPSQTALPGHVVSRRRGRRGGARGRGRSSTAAMTSATPAQRTISAGWRSIMAFQSLTDGVVVRVARLEELTAQLRAKSLEHLLVKGRSVIRMVGSLTITSGPPSAMSGEVDQTTCGKEPPAFSGLVSAYVDGQAPVRPRSERPAPEAAYLVADSPCRPRSPRPDGA